MYSAKIKVCYLITIIFHHEHLHRKKETRGLLKQKFIASQIFVEMLKHYSAADGDTCTAV